MRNRGLHDALRAFALESARVLQEEHEAGAELGFEVAEEPGRGPVLYRYQPLTADFIGERWTRLSALSTFEPAGQALGAGAASYLRRRGVPGADPAPALRVMLERLYEEATSFAFPEERFEHVYREVERTLYEQTTRTTIVAPLHGLVCKRARVELGEGLALARGESIEAPAEAVWPDQLGDQEPRAPNALCVLERDVPSDAPPPVAEARARFRELLTGLRLFKAGGLGFGPLCFVRADDAPWQTAPLGFSGPARGEPFVLAPGEGGSLRSFLDSLGSAPRGTAVSWALARFEMGCERALAVEALSDYLLALAALLDGAEGGGRVSLGLRLAGLCADDHDPREVQRCVERAFALERFAISGGGGDACLETMGSEPPPELVLAVEEHLRALLRAVLCGLLDADLRSLADDILLGRGEPFEIRARDLRGGEVSANIREREEPRVRPGDRDFEPPGGVGQPERADGEEDPAEADTGELEAIGDHSPDLPDGVTPSADWEAHEDPATYSAPV